MLIMACRPMKRLFARVSMKSRKLITNTTLNKYSFCNVEQKNSKAETSNSNKLGSTEIVPGHEKLNETETKASLADSSNSLNETTEVKKQETQEQLIQEEIKKEEIIICILLDKHSVKPEKEFRISHETSHRITKGGIIRKSLNYGIHTISEIKSFTSKIIDFFAYKKKQLYFFWHPKGYPDRFPADYKYFSRYTFIANVSFNVMNFISTQVLINSLGLVNKSTSYALSAGLNYVIKEGFGQAGSITFMAKYGKKMEKNLIEWRITNYTLGNIAVFMELATLLRPEHFIAIASFANTLKLINSAGNNFTRQGIIQHYASTKYQILNLTAKLNMQNNIALFIGNLIGFIVSLNIPSGIQFSFAIVSLFACINTASVLRSMKNIVLTDFNFKRLVIFCEQYVIDKKILSPSEVHKHTSSIRKFKNIKFCTHSLEFIIRRNHRKKYYPITIFEIFKDSNFICYLKRNRVLSLLNKKRYFDIYIMLKFNADNNDIFLAFLYSVKIWHEIQQLRLDRRKDVFDWLDNRENVFDLLKECLTFINKLDKKVLFEKIKDLGWILDFKDIEEKYVRYHMVFKNL